MSKKVDIVSREIAETEKQMLLEKYKTAMKKAQLVDEIKTGLGSEIKKNPGKAKILKKTRWQKFILALKNIFTKF